MENKGRKSELPFWEKVSQTAKPNILRLYIIVAFNAYNADVFALVLFIFSSVPELV
jgi:hypothetical protein